MPDSIGGFAEGFFCSSFFVYQGAIFHDVESGFSAEDGEENQTPLEQGIVMHWTEGDSSEEEDVVRSCR